MLLQQSSMLSLLWAPGGPAQWTLVSAGAGLDCGAPDSLCLHLVLGQEVLHLCVSRRTEQLLTDEQVAPKLLR